MKNYNLKKIITVVSCAVLSALFIVVLFFSATKTDAVPETSGKITKLTYVDGVINELNYTIGTDITAVRINDLGELGKITKVNYVANEFTHPSGLDYDFQIVDLTQPFEFAEKGTLMFVVMNLDPWDNDNFLTESERLAPYKVGENWYFTLSLPAVFGASNVYSNAELIERNSDIAGYSFSEFCNYDLKTENFTARTQPTEITLKFSSWQRALNNVIVTVHYQSTGSNYSGIKDCPLIGTESAVKGINESSKNLLITFTILSVVVLAVLIVLSLLKHTGELVSAIVWIFGIALLFISRFFLAQTTGVPLLWVAFRLAASSVILGGALLSMGRNFGKVPTKYIFPALAVAGALFAFICPFIPFGAASAMSIVSLCFKGVCAVALLGFIGLATFRREVQHGIMQIVCAAIIAVAVCASLFLPQIFPAQINPVFWLFAATIIMTFVSVFMIFKETEKANEYLTANLHLEVERQVKDIKAVISERDKLLQFVSHDMKKPLSSAVMMCDTAIEREKDGEQIKTLSIIKQDAERVINHLSEIASYARLNYIAEPSQVVDMFELCALLHEYHKFDCDANGIILNNTVNTSVKAFVKPKGIENVVSNIIINAIEHANCTTVTLSVKSDRNKVVLCIADDGKGIDSGLDVFRPYISENDTETGGLGLYICKNIIESMNGELSFETGRGGTVFYISLLKA